MSGIPSAPRKIQCSECKKPISGARTVIEGSTEGARMNPWIEKLRAAGTKVERDEILLKSFEEAKKMQRQGWHVQAERAEYEVEEQIRALADEAFGK